MSTSPQTFVSYAQNGEDIVVWRALSDVQDGFFVDVGAGDPIGYSVTYALYQRGWRGVNIEAAPAPASALRMLRPRDVTLAVAAGRSRGTLDLHVVPGTGLSTVLDEQAVSLAEMGFESERVRVEVVPLAELLDAHVPREQPIHLLKIDVEGAEEDVLRGMSFDEWRPWICVVEATRPLSRLESFEAWEPILLGAGYRFCLFDGLNRYYLADEHADRADRLRSGPNVFDQPFQRADVSLAIERHREQLVDDIDQLMAENATLRVGAEEAATELASARRTLGQVCDALETARVALAAVEAELVDERGHRVDAERALAAETARAAEQAAQAVELEAASRQLAADLDRISSERDAARQELQLVYASETWRAGTALRRLGTATRIDRLLRRRPR
jgi:FkbM family methyltransferase